ncbi:hydantoinase B/oxoprolinase family protein [Dactylosporangium sp. CA-092794]|uniref:hydantoinase B/oxoprolinase family protein n=1 Tax=Dactylosporangium sp. CA-092794 TaxID=3239929 RepID=UPI003D8B7CFE
MKPDADAVDPVRLEVMRNALASIAEEMGATLIRSAYSTNIKDRRDCSCAIYLDGAMIAQGEHIPYHLGFMHSAGRELWRRLGADTLAEGDVIVTNDPWITGSHLCDILVYSPVFHDGRAIAFVATMAHHVDVGGMASGSCPPLATQIYQEGVRIPPVHVQRGGRFVEDVVELVAANLRTPRDFRGDLRAQVAANTVGARRIGELVGRHGAEAFAALADAIADYSERRMRAAIAALPDGEATFEDYIEGDGLTDELIPIRCTVRIDGSDVHIDFTGSAPPAAGSVNAPPALPHSCAYFVVKAVADPHVPSNDGAYRPIHVHLPEHSIVNAPAGAAVSNANPVTGLRVADALFGAFAQLVPGRVGAASSGSLSALLIGGRDPRHDRPYAYIETYGGGQGAHAGQDGFDAIQTNMSNTANAPVEAIELAYPLLIERYGLVEDSGGAGRHRGGLGIHREVRVLGHRAQVTIAGDRGRIGPWGLDGGRPGMPSSWTRVTAGGERVALGSKVILDADPGDLLILRTAGGGGHGDPARRDPGAAEHDRREGLVTA